MSAITKRDILAEWIKETTETVESGITVETGFRKDILGNTSLRTLRQTMGDPVYYADCLLRGQTSEVSRADRDAGRVHTYDVRLWREYEDAASYSNRSQKTFDNITYGSNGLIPTLFSDQCLDTNKGRAGLTLEQLQNGFNDEVTIDILHDQDLLLAHLLTFTIVLR